MKEKCQKCKKELSSVCYRNKGESNQTRISGYFYCVKCDLMYKTEMKRLFGSLI